MQYQSHLWVHLEAVAGDAEPAVYYVAVTDTRMCVVQRGVGVITHFVSFGSRPAGLTDLSNKFGKSDEIGRKDVYIPSV